MTSGIEVIDVIRNLDLNLHVLCSVLPGKHAAVYSVFVSFQSHCVSPTGTSLIFFPPVHCICILAAAFPGMKWERKESKRRRDSVSWLLQQLACSHLDYVFLLHLHLTMSREGFCFVFKLLVALA